MPNTNSNTPPNQPTHDNNFCRVFELPETYPKGFCFGGGRPVNFQMVDWFEPWPRSIETGELENRTWEEVQNMLINFLQEKSYIKDRHKYLVITEFNESFLFSK
jgi:hypothetical protein